MKRQAFTEINGITYKLCSICGQAIKYPDGIFFRSGKEIHNQCLTIARMRRGKIEGIDK